MLFKSGSGRSVIENNHSKAKSAGLVFPVYVQSSGFLNVNLHFSALPWFELQSRMRNDTTIY